MANFFDLFAPPNFRAEIRRLATPEPIVPGIRLHSDGCAQGPLVCLPVDGTRQMPDAHKEKCANCDRAIWVPAQAAGGTVRICVPCIRRRLARMGVGS
jgi:hypothetical protein